MNKQFQGSKKKSRKKAWQHRKIERINSKPRIAPIDQSMSMEDMAREMGIRLR